nr:hypothetical protein BaRGS_020978 [Batillaria attramentaria]
MKVRVDDDGMVLITVDVGHTQLGELFSIYGDFDLDNTETPRTPAQVACNDIEAYPQGSMNAIMTCDRVLYAILGGNSEGLTWRWRPS